MRLGRFVLVVGFVHPDFLDTSFNIRRDALSTFSFILAFSTDDERVRAVVESKSKVTPDRTVADLLLVARGNGSEFTVRRSSLGLNNRSLGVEFTSSGSVETSSSLGNDFLSSNGGGSGKERSSTEVELEEISLSLSVIGDTHKLGSSSNDVQGVPFLGGVVSGSTENGSPSGGGELEVESTGDGLVSSTLVRGFVHPYFLEVTFDLSSGARAKVLSTSAFSGGNSLLFTVSESQSDLTPDRAVGDLLLVPGLDFSDLTVLVRSDSFSDRGTGEELSSHGSVEASTLLGNGDGSSNSGHDGSLGVVEGTEASSTKVELEEISLRGGIESSSIELSTTAFNLRRIPLLDGTFSTFNSSACGSENLSPSVVESKLETGRHELILFALVVRLVHPDLVDVASDIFSLADADLGVRLALSRFEGLARAVSESNGHLTPDRAVGYLLLVTRGDLSNLAVSISFDGSDFGSSLEECSSHRTVEATFLECGAVLGTGKANTLLARESTFI